MRWEPVFFVWFGGLASQGRALAGPRGGLYAGEAFVALRAALKDYETDRPERLTHAYFTRTEPEELLYDEIEAIWTRIAEDDDWSAFAAKLASIDAAREAMELLVDVG